MFANFLLGVFTAAMALTALHFVFETSIHRRMSAISIPAFRGGCAIGLTACVVFTLIAWAAGADDWYLLGYLNGFGFPFVAYLSAVYLTQRLARSMVHKGASLYSFTPAAIPLSEKRGIHVRASTVQEITDYRCRVNGNATFQPKQFAQTRFYRGGK